MSPEISQLVAENAGWIIAFIGMVIGLAGLLVAYGALRARISVAAEKADHFRSQLYHNDGGLVYMPRNELLPILQNLEIKMKEATQKIADTCAENRQDCRTTICGHIDLLRKDSIEVHKSIDGLEEKYHDQNLGFVALSAQLSILLKAQGQEPPQEIMDIERRLRKNATQRLRRYTDDTIVFNMPEFLEPKGKGGDTT